MQPTTTHAIQVKPTLIIIILNQNEIDVSFWDLYLLHQLIYIRDSASIIWTPPEIETGSYAHLLPNL